MERKTFSLRISHFFLLPSSSFTCIHAVHAVLRAVGVQIKLWLSDYVYIHTFTVCENCIFAHNINPPSCWWNLIFFPFKLSPFSQCLRFDMLIFIAMPIILCMFVYVLPLNENFNLGLTSAADDRCDLKQRR